MKIITGFLIFFLFAKTVPSQNFSSIEWLNHNLIPLNTVVAGNGFTDLKNLDSIIGNAQIVSMGECTHGSSEIFKMKHRMFEYLVIEKGFKIFSIEANMPEAYAVNQYILEGKGDPKKLVGDMHFWTWYTEEVVEMVKWMKSYNDTSSRKIMFTGFDMQFVSASCNILKLYCDKNKISLKEDINRFDSLGSKYISEKKAGRESENLTNTAERIFDKIEKSSSDKNDNDYQWALQNARLLVQFAALKSGGQSRDESMAENVKWIVAQNPGSKIMLWAHNLHVIKEKAKFGYLPIPMGHFLSQYFKERIISVGFSTEEGSYTAVSDKHNGKQILTNQNILLQSGNKTAEYTFKGATEKNFILNIRGVKEDDKTKWLFQKTSLRSLGAIANDKFQFVDCTLTTSFDMIIFLYRTNASKYFSVKENP